MRLKHLLKYALSPFTATIRTGALKGRRWVIASGSRFVRGTYEPRQCEVFQRLARPGGTVFDVGAHVGFYTVLSSQLTGPDGRVFAFEPLPANLRYLRRHCRINGCANVTVYEVAVGDRDGTARFDDSHGTGVGHLSSGGSLDVRVRALDAMIASGEVPVPDFIKVDVEGAELLVLDGAKRLLTDHLPVVVLSVHSDDLDRECRGKLASLGYTVTEVDRHVLLASPPGHSPRA